MLYRLVYYNDSPQACRQLRIQFGIRFWFTDIWPKGYTSQRIYDENGQPIVAGVMTKKRPRGRPADNSQTHAHGSIRHFRRLRARRSGFMDTTFASKGWLVRVTMPDE